MDALNLDYAQREDDIINFYNMYRNNDVSELPNSFWMSPNGRYRAKIIGKYVIENILMYTRRIDIIRKLSIKDFKNNKLSNMTEILFNNDIFQTVDNIYPDTYKRCMFNVKRNYWDADLVREELEIIAKGLNKNVRELKIKDINKADFLGGERVFQKQFGGFDNFLDKYYPDEHWWVPRRHGVKRTGWSDSQEKEAITYVLVNKLGIDINDTQSYHHVTVRDFYSEHMRFICDKYEYNVCNMINKYYPNLKITNRILNEYILVSPSGEQYRTNNLRAWIKNNKNLFNTNAKETSIENVLKDISKPQNSYRTYYGWHAYKVIT